MAERKNLNTIKAVLKHQGRSQSWLAREMGMSFATVNGWCNNRNQPYLVDLVKVAEILEVAPVELIVNGTVKRKRPDKSI